VVRSALPLPTLQIVFNRIETTLLVVTAVGLLARGRARLCWSFFAYVVWVLVSHVLIGWWPERFWRLPVFIGNETVLFVLKAAIAIEIWRRTFTSLPRARNRVGVFLAAAVLGAWLLELAPTGWEDNAFVWFVGVVNPRRQAAVLALLAIVGIAASWYRVPLHPLHRVILLGFAMYLAANTLGSSLVAWNAWYSRSLAVVVIGTSYIGALIWWVRTAWSRPGAPHPVVTKLQPWARSW
jgi:hypothetical protein